MVVVIKLDGQLNDYENLRILAGYMINIEAGVQYYDAEGRFRESKKPFNIYNHNGVEFTFKPTVGKIVILGRGELSMSDLVAAMAEMTTPHVKNYFPCSASTGQHVLLERKIHEDVLPTLAMSTTFANQVAFRFIFKHQSEGHSQKMISEHLASCFKWIVGCSSTIATGKYIFSLDLINRTTHELNLAPSTILIDTRNYTKPEIGTGYKTMNYLTRKAFNFDDRMCQRKIVSCDINQVYCALAGTPYVDVVRETPPYVRWEDIKLVKYDPSLKLNEHFSVDYKKQLIDELQDIKDGKPPELLKCMKCHYPVFDECLVTVMKENVHYVTHTCCRISGVRTYSTIAPQGFYEVFKELKADQNSKDLLEGLYLNGHFKKTGMVFVVNQKKKKIFIQSDFMTNSMFRHPELYLFSTRQL